MSALAAKFCLHHPKETVPTEICSIHFISTSLQDKGQPGMSHLTFSPWRISDQNSRVEEITRTLTIIILVILYTEGSSAPSIKEENNYQLLSSWVITNGKLEQDPNRGCWEGISCHNSPNPQKLADEVVGHGCYTHAQASSQKCSPCV